MATETKVKGKLKAEGGVNLPAEPVSRVPIVNGVGDIVSSSITTTELSYISGVTSSVQDQIDDVVTDLSDHITDATDAHDASAISYDDTTNGYGTDVQNALTNAVDSASDEFVAINDRVNTNTERISDLEEIVNSINTVIPTVGTPTLAPTVGTILLTHQNTSGIPQLITSLRLSSDLLLSGSSSITVILENTLTIGTAISTIRLSKDTPATIINPLEYTLPDTETIQVRVTAATSLAGKTFTATTERTVTGVGLAQVAFSGQASDLAVTPSGNLTSINAQAAFVELQSDIDNRALDSDVIKKDGSVAFTAAQSMGGFKLTSVAAPTAGSDAATKNYVDNALEGLKPKSAVRAATTVAGTLATSFEDGQVIDGVTLATGDRILIKDQAAPEDNGIYIVQASGAPVRSTDFDSVSPIDEINKAFVATQEGTTNAGKIFVQYGVVTTIGVDAINFTFFNSISGLTGGDGITVSGSNIAVDHDGEGLTFVATQLSLELDGTTLAKSASGLKLNDTAVTPASLGSATETVSFTVDQQGRLTAASEQSIAIPASQVTDFDEAAQDAVGTILADSSSIDFTYSDATPSITAVVLPAGVDHDALLNFVANEHINHSSVEIQTIADSGLTGGGDITATRSLSVDITGTTALAATPDNADELMIWDDSASALKKVTVSELLANAAAGSPGDIQETSFSLADGQAAPDDVTGFTFAVGVVRSFKALVSVEIDATADLYESFEILGIQKTSSWDMSILSTGDNSGVTFSITSAGQIQYTSNTYAGFSSGSIKFRAKTTSF